jgi:hypothetical protein
MRWHFPFGGFKQFRTTLRRLHFLLADTHDFRHCRPLQRIAQERVGWESLQQQSVAG